MTVFKNCSVVLELKNLPIKEKKRLKLAITDNGGSIAYVVNKQCTFIVTSSLASLSCNRQRSAQKHQVPVVGLQYVWSCLEKGVLLPVGEHSLEPPSPTPSTAPPHESVLKVTGQPPAVQIQKSKDQPPQSDAHLTETANSLVKGSTYLGKFRVYTENDHDLPEYPSNFQVAKYSFFEKVNTWSVLELQSAKGEAGQQYRVVRSVHDGEEAAAVRDKLVCCSSSEEALEVYQTLRKELQVGDFKLTPPPEAKNLGSHSLQQLLLEEKLNCSTLSQEVGVFVELVWTEALGCLGNILTVPLTSISLNDVTRAEGLLLQVQRRGKEAEAGALLEEVSTLLPHRLADPPACQAKLVSQKLDLCQLIRDMLNVSEATLQSPSPSCLGKYRALRCSIECVPPDSPEFQSVRQLLQDRPVKIQQVLCVSRGAELQLFREELGNVKPLLHSSSPRSFVGILSRGLLLPRVGVEHHGIERTDIGYLGSGIYFSDSLSTSVKYSKPSMTDGCHLLLVCEVALGHCRDLQKKDTSLTCAPEGFHSVHGVRRSPKTLSEFEDDEYVVYSTDQVRMKYVVQYTLEEDQVKVFQPAIDTSVELTQPVATSDLLSAEDSEGVEVGRNPLEAVTAGLLDSSGQTLPLQAVHVRCKLMDLLSQVVIFQTYTNQSAVPIEAKYVFPLDESAAVCGFEAFINGKHVIGKVKEKEQARKEYKQAIEKGHGAYLMDQDAPDVFTISVGNLPPGATVLIKVTFITELIVRAGSLLFSLPASVAPWQQSSALNQRTQVTVEKVCVSELQAEGDFSLVMSIEMPYELTDLCSVTHRIKIKRTDCKAVVRTLPGETLGSDGFLLSFSLSQIHLPRMWVEKHPEKDSQACMLVFYPDFASSGVSDSGPGSGVSDVVILLDTSESMRGEALLNARRVALQVLKTLDRTLKVNVLSFGTDHKEAFPSSHLLQEAYEPARKFIMSSPPVGGSTELWRPLRSLSLLPPSRGVRNLLLLSDGHVQNQPLTLQMVRDHARHTRLFTCGLSPTANRHMLRALAQAGGGSYEFFDTKTKHTWAEKVESQVKRMVSLGCSSVSVKWQQFNPTAPPPVQAPVQLHALFSDCHTLVYGFVPHCTQATLLGDVSGQEIKTMVSTTELQKTKGTFLHKLTARAVIRDYEDGSLDTNEAKHEGRKAELKSYIIELSKEFSILSQFTSFVAIEERDAEQPDSGFTDVLKLIAEEDVDFLPYVGWEEEDVNSPSDELSVSTVSREYEEAEVSEDDYEVMYAEEVLFGEKKAELSPIEDILSHTAINGAMLSDYICEEFFDDIYAEMWECDAASLPSPPQAPPAGQAASRSKMGKLCLSVGAASPHALELSTRDVPLSLPAAKMATRASRLSRRRASSGLLDYEAPGPMQMDSPPRLDGYSGVMLQAAPPVLLGTPLPMQMGVPPRLDCVVRHRSERAAPSPPPAELTPQDLSLHRDPSRSAPKSTGLRRPTAYFVPLDAPRAEMEVTGRLRKNRFSSSQDAPPPPPPGLPLSLFAQSLPYPSDPPLLPILSASSLLPPLPPPGPVGGLGSAFGLGPAGLGSSSFQAGFRELSVKGILSDLLPGMSGPPREREREVIPASEISLAAPSGFTFAAAMSKDCAPQSTLFRAGGSLVGADASLFGASSGGPLPYLPTSFLASRPLHSHSLHTSHPPPPPPPVGGAKGRPRTTSCVYRGNVDLFGDPSVMSVAAPSGFTFGAAVSKDGPPQSSVFDADDFLCGSGFSFLGAAPGAPKETPWSTPPSVESNFSVKMAAIKPPSPEKKERGTDIPRCIKLVKSGRSREAKWEELFDLQHQDGYWECTKGLGSLLGLDVDFFANVFLKEKGIRSLGVKAHADILRLVATLLVLQLMRGMRLAEGELLQSLFRLQDSPQPKSPRWQAVRRGVDWACWADRQYPCVCSRLEFGWDWESATRQLLGFDPQPPFSPLTPVLERSERNGLIIAL